MFSWFLLCKEPTVPKFDDLIAFFSKRMRVPDRLLLAGDGHNTNGFDERPAAKKENNVSDYHRMMTVPDRILV
jgi:hypothetical protein